MPAFPEKDSLLLSKLYKTAPWMAKLHDGPGTGGQESETTEPPEESQTTGAVPPGSGGDPSDPIYCK